MSPAAGVTASPRPSRLQALPPKNGTRLFQPSSPRLVLSLAPGVTENLRLLQSPAPRPPVNTAAGALAKYLLQSPALPLLANTAAGALAKCLPPLPAPRLPVNTAAGALASCLLQELALRLLGTEDGDTVDGALVVDLHLLRPPALLLPKNTAVGATANPRLLQLPAPPLLKAPGRPRLLPLLALHLLVRPLPGAIMNPHPLLL